jgi:hypothetical protein
MTMKRNSMNTMAAALIWLAAAQTGWCFYNPSTGRWLSRDPIGESGGLNLYAFANNDSLQRIDVTGLSSENDPPTTVYNRGLPRYCQKCRCKRVQLKPKGSIEIRPIGDKQNLGLPIPYVVETEGLRPYCKCRYTDSGSVSYTLSGPSGSGSGSQLFDRPEDTHDIACQSGQDQPGIIFNLPPNVTVNYSLTYNLTVTLTCEGNDGSYASDSATITGTHTGTAP